MMSLMQNGIFVPCPFFLPSSSYFLIISSVTSLFVIVVLKFDQPTMTLTVMLGGFAQHAKNGLPYLVEAVDSPVSSAGVYPQIRRCVHPGFCKHV
jgi:hypothetical protein